MFTIDIHFCLIRVTLEISSKHITAEIVHHLGQKPISVSTKEWCLKKYLYRYSNSFMNLMNNSLIDMRNYNKFIFGFLVQMTLVRPS